MGEEFPLGPPSGGRVPPVVTYVAIATLLALGLAIALWEYLTSLYLLMVLAWLLVAGGLAATVILPRLKPMDGQRVTLVVLGVALAWRYLMLFQEEVITNDVVSFVGRGQAYLGGKVPYTEGFTVNKPPAYLFLAAGLGSAVGPSLLATRAIMSLVDALVAVAVFWLGEERFGRPFGLMAGLLYAVNPVSAVAVGIAGHYDPWVVILAVAGLWMLLRRNLGASALLLGAGFALKLYPVVLLPWVLLAEERWSRRVGLAVLFASPMAVSWVPVLLQNPDALSFYLDYQATWEAKGGIAFGLGTIMGLGPGSASMGVLARVVELVFLGLLVAMFVDWLRRRHHAPGDHLLDWFRVVTLGFAVLYGALLVGGVVEYGLDLGAGTDVTAALVAAVYALFAGAGLHWTWERWLRGDHGLGEDDHTVMLAALSVNLLLLSSSQYNPWYLLWLLPLILLVRSWRVRDAWTALVLWKPEGRGVSVWPGLDMGPR